MEGRLASADVILVSMFLRTKGEMVKKRIEELLL